MSEKKVKLFQVSSRNTLNYGWMREDSNLIYRTKLEAERKYGVVKMTQRAFDGLYIWSENGGTPRDFTREEKSAIARAYNEYYN